MNRQWGANCVVSSGIRLKPTGFFLIALYNNPRLPGQQQGSSGVEILRKRLCSHENPQRASKQVDFNFNLAVLQDLILLELKLRY
jgi:hypothetical protein